MEVFYFFLCIGVIHQDSHRAFSLEKQDQSSSSLVGDGWQIEALTKELEGKGKNLPSRLVIFVAMKSQPTIAARRFVEHCVDWYAGIFLRVGSHSAQLHAGPRHGQQGDLLHARPDVQPSRSRGVFRDSDIFQGAGWDRLFGREGNVHYRMFLKIF